MLKNCGCVYDELCSHNTFTETLITDSDTPIVIKKLSYSKQHILLLSDQGSVYTVQLNTVEPSARQVTSFEGTIVLDIQAHSEGLNFLALNSEHKIFLCNVNDDTYAGSKDTTTATKILALMDKYILKIFCGSISYAAVSITGELYTWGQGVNGNLGHGSSENKLTPCLVEALAGHSVTDIALGNAELPTLCVTDMGDVFGWGCSSNSGSQIPVALRGMPFLTRIFSMEQSFIGLTIDGHLCEWPKNHIQRLNTYLNEHAKKKTDRPNAECDAFWKKFIILKGKQIADVAVGTAHCVVLMRSGELYGWGRNDFRQICKSAESYIFNPVKMTSINVPIDGLACGATSTHIYINTKMGLNTHEQYMVDLSESTFNHIDKLLSIIDHSLYRGKMGTEELRHPPPQGIYIIYI